MRSPSCSLLLFSSFSFVAVFLATAAQGAQLPPELSVSLVVISSGQTQVERTSTWLKSILAARSHMMHVTVFMLVDDAAKSGLEPLVAQVRGRCLDVIYVDAGPLMAHTRDWIIKTKFRTSHYGGHAAMSKLFVWKFLPDHVEDFIVVDNDLVFLHDPVGAFHEARGEQQQHPQTILATPYRRWDTRFNLDESQVQTRCVAQRLCHPVVYDQACFVYMNRTRAKAAEWDSLLYREVVNVTTMLPSYESSVADMDVMNIMLGRHPHLFAPLPHKWNCDINAYKSIVWAAEAHKTGVLPSLGMPCAVVHYQTSQYNLPDSSPLMHFPGLWNTMKNLRPIYLNTTLLCRDPPS